MNALKKIIHYFFIIAILGSISINCNNQELQQKLQSNIILPPQNQTIWEGEMVYFKGVASGGDPPYSYLWQFGADISSSTQQIPGEVVFNYEGAYSVKMIVKDSKGHVNTDIVLIIVKRKEAL